MKENGKQSVIIKKRNNKNDNFMLLSSVLCYNHYSERMCYATVSLGLALCFANGLAKSIDSTRSSFANSKMWYNIESLNAINYFAYKMNRTYIQPHTDVRKSGNIKPAKN
uniref:Uncharacterized protein n=1 Tax=Glossina pallidipes TaxID=7398 RepID=A0A1B0AJK0_GLOPL